ncbi:TetR family transcriptional regulator [Caballeronia sp. LZ025]|uniref:TetR/AcrR family transcriptional regulator n=1 Tax=Caballeronia TaxID=1827195 RepID=UPI001FD31391|nr:MULTISPECIES: TetR/AcrR family transcriptional regulator [Caballeronia]MDR5735980.1 TetR family transcriptional regulator [Caballeronia sp. LZ025]
MSQVTETGTKTTKRDPEGTRRRILEAATEQFSTLGLAGARVDAIAQAAGTNERMLYYYFGSKEQLYVAVLESMYADFAKKESGLDLSELQPGEAIATLAESIWAHLWDNPRWLGLINGENLNRGRYLKSCEKLRATVSPVVEVISTILDRGVAAGRFRRDVDPLDFYVTLVGMGYYIASNRYTISAFAGRDYADHPAREKMSGMHLAMLEAYLGSTP